MTTKITKTEEEWQRELTPEQYEILRRAQELKIPVTKDNLIIKKSRESIRVEAHYQITIDFFNGLYTYVWKFDPVVERPLFAV